MKGKTFLRKIALRGTIAFTAVFAVYAAAALLQPIQNLCYIDDLALQNILPVQATPNSTVPQEKVVYLTFDDGPSPTTEKILDTLKQEQVPASFFVICAPNNEEHFPLVARIKEEGHCIALHSCTHEYKRIYKSTDAFWADIAKLQDALIPYGCGACNVLRFPGGSTNTVSRRYGGSDIMNQLKEQAVEKGFTYIDWNVSADDAFGAHPSASKIYNNIIHDVEDKSSCIVLMHDTKATPNTAAALPDVIAWFKNAGFRFDTVDHLPQNG